MLEAFISEAVHKIVDRKIVLHIHTVVVAVRCIRTVPVSAFVVVARIEVDRRTAADRMAVVEVDLDTSAGLRFGCAAGTKRSPCIRTTSPMPTRRSLRIQSSENRFC